MKGRTRPSRSSSSRDQGAWREKTRVSSSLCSAYVDSGSTSRRFEATLPFDGNVVGASWPSTSSICVQDSRGLYPLASCRLLQASWSTWGWRCPPWHIRLLELLDDLFPHFGGISFENAWAVLVALFVALFKLCRCVLNVANSHSLGVFHHLCPAVHPDDRFFLSLFPSSSVMYLVNFRVGTLLTSASVYARSYPTQGLFMEEDILRGWHVVIVRWGLSIFNKKVLRKDMYPCWHTSAPWAEQMGADGRTVRLRVVGKRQTEGSGRRRADDRKQSR
eukprot:scaffold698_cov133-Alexandrium_tamarense.AAC.6